MKKYILVKPFIFFVGLFFLFTCKANAGFVLQNEEIVGERAVQKIESMGGELFSKSGVSVYLVAIESTGDKDIVTFEKEASKKLNAPFVLLTLTKKEQKVDIISSDKLKNRFDKEQILSAYPWKGTIIPLLSVKKDEDKYSAAILNGYADIIEQVAKSYNITLESAIGSTNKTTIGYIRALFYGVIFLVLGIFVYRRMNARKI